MLHVLLLSWDLLPPDLRGDCRVRGSGGGCRRLQGTVLVRLIIRTQIGLYSHAGSYARAAGVLAKYGFQGLLVLDLCYFDYLQF